VRFSARPPSSPWLATTTTTSKSTSSQLSIDTTEFQHDDFEVIRKDDRYRGFDEVKLVNRNFGEMSNLHFFRKLMPPFSPVEFDNLMEFHGCVLKEGCSGAVYPIYEHEGLKWVLMSVPHDRYEATGLAPPN